MKNRPWWSETSQSNTLFNFKWQQTKQGYKYERLIPNQMYKQLVNHFEYHKEITTKSGLIKNLAQYCEVIIILYKPFFLKKMIDYYLNSK
jgi:hypothetical protein